MTSHHHHNILVSHFHSISQSLTHFQELFYPWYWVGTHFALRTALTLCGHWSTLNSLSFLWNKCGTICAVQHGALSSWTSKALEGDICGWQQYADGLAHLYTTSMVLVGWHCQLWHSQVEPMISAADTRLCPCHQHVAAEVEVHWVID